MLNIRNMIARVFGVVVYALTVTCVYAHTITATFINDARCDSLSDQPLTHQLGQAPAFPIDERVTLLSIESNAQPACVALDPNLADNFQVTIRNDSPTAWQDLYLVAAGGNSFGNADGFLTQPIDIGPFPDAFRIDAAGTNANLIYESLVTNGIFEPNEIWTFLVTDFSAVSVSSLFSSPGLEDGSDPAHLLANPVPVPAALWLMFSSLIGLVALGTNSRRRT